MYRSKLDTFDAFKILYAFPIFLIQLSLVLQQKDYSNVSKTIFLEITRGVLFNHVKKSGKNIYIACTLPVFYRIDNYYFISKMFLHYNNGSSFK